MPEDADKFGRTLALNTAADSLGFDEATRKAMTHLETLIAIMSQGELTWDDIPDRFSLEAAIGEKTLKTLCEADPGLELTVQAQHDSNIRRSLLANYVKCIGVALPGETMTVEETLQTLIARE